MGGLMPPGAALDGPPPQPPGSPSVAGIPPGPPPGPAGGPQQGGPGPGSIGALPKLVFEIENSIKTLARALPGDAAEQLDSVIQQVRNVVAQALQGSSGQPGGGGPTAGSGPY